MFPLGLISFVVTASQLRPRGVLATDVLLVKCPPPPPPGVKCLFNITGSPHNLCVADCYFINLVLRALFPGFPRPQSQGKAPWGRGCYFIVNLLDLPFA